MPIKSEYRKRLVLRGFQMLVIGLIFNLGVTIIGLLALIQFFWMLFTKERNNFIADLGTAMKNWVWRGIGVSSWVQRIQTFPVV